MISLVTGNQFPGLLSFRGLKGGEILVAGAGSAGGSPPPPPVPHVDNHLLLALVWRA